MHYFIDGYNLMFRRLRAGDELQSQRELLIKELDEQASDLDLDITIVFDAQYRIGLGSRSHFHHVEICFTDENETADDYIIEALKRTTKPQQETVVTSDKKLAWQARRRLAKTESVEQFIKWINKRSVNKNRRLSEPRLPEPSPSLTMPTNVSNKESIPEYESDIDRWLRIFEERFQHLDQDDNN